MTIFLQTWLEDCLLISQLTFVSIFTYSKIDVSLISWIETNKTNKINRDVNQE